MEAPVLLTRCYLRCLSAELLLLLSTLVVDTQTPWFLQYTCYGGWYLNDRNGPLQ
jgi:hypothetical protein